MICMVSNGVTLRSADTNAADQEANRIQARKLTFKIN